MIYFFHGKNTKEARKSLSTLIEMLLKKKPNAERFRITSEDFESAYFQELIESRGLFEERYIVVLDCLCEEKAIQEEILRRLKELKESENIFLLLEGVVLKKTIAKIEKYAEKSQVFELEKEVGTKEKKDFNVFSLTDALGEKNKKKLWMLYREALENNKSAEELHGLLFWQLKSMLLARKGDGPKDTGLKPFVFTKSKRFAQNFKEGELQKISREFVRVYHDARAGGLTLTLGLEKIILEM